MRALLFSLEWQLYFWFRSMRRTEQEVLPPSFACSLLGHVTGPRKRWDHSQGTDEEINKLESLQVHTPLKMTFMMKCIVTGLGCGVITHTDSSGVLLAIICLGIQFFFFFAFNKLPIIQLMYISKQKQPITSRKIHDGRLANNQCTEAAMF